jgi:phenylacetate-CoA ligase
VITPPPRYFDRSIEALDVAQIQRLQDRLVQETMAAVQGNAFFSSIYRRAGVDVSRVRSVRDLRELPIIRKSDIVEDISAHPPYGRRLAVPEDRVANIVESSGTSASGKEVQALTARDLQRIVDAEKVGFIWAGAMEGTVVAVNLPVGMTAAGYWWNLALQQMSCNTLRLGGLPTEKRLSYLSMYGAEMMLCDSQYLRRMSHVADALGFKLRREMPRMAAIFVGGGGWNEREVEQWAEDWGAVLHEQYGSSQRCIAWTCENGILGPSGRNMVHFLPHQYLVEVLDPLSGEHVDEGGDGEIVLTLFGYEATPLVRYGTRDRGRWRRGASCCCGRSFDGLEAGSVARLDDMMRVRGLNLWPDEVDKVVFASPSVADYRAEVWQDGEANERVSLLVNVVDEAQVRAEEVAGDLSIQLKSATGLRVEVTPRVISVREVAQSSSDTKPRRWSDLRGNTVLGPTWDDEK